MIYFLLFLHFGFNIFFMMCFAAFIFASTQNKLLEVLLTVCLSVYTIIELIGVSLLQINGYESALWPIWLGAVFIASSLSLVLYFCHKLDISIWGVFSIVFAPIIIIPAFLLLLVINAYKLSNTGKNKKA